MTLSDQRRWWESGGRQGLRDLLMTHWDPIGVADAPEAADEYDECLEPVAGILAAGGGPRDVAEYLARVEREMMELGPVTAGDLLELGERIVQWYASAVHGRLSDAGKSALEKARADIRSERLWKARDRLTAAVNHDPTDQELLELIGDVYFKMGDLPNAGRFWLLTGREDDAVELALSSFEERWGGNLGEKLKMVPIAAGFEEYPAPAQRRLLRLQGAARRAGIRWPRPGRRKGHVEDDATADSAMSASDWLTAAVLLIAGPGLWLLGIAAAIYLLLN